MLMMREGRKSYWGWARSLTTIIGKTVSKQAIFNRMNQTWVATVKMLVGEVLRQQIGKQIKHHLFSGFKNVWLQDSTTLHLPEVLFEKFRGNIIEGKKNSVAKLNIIVHALNGLCPLMEWNCFAVTEQYLSSKIISIAKAGDLVIRDLGYFVLGVFKKMSETNIFFLSRWRYGVIVYNAKTGGKINLLRLLRGKEWIDLNVICGREEQLKLRLVAIKLPSSQASERRRKARQDRHRNANHSKEYYTLLGYVVFITNVSDEVWDYRQVAQAYRVRWNIEILFKSWKSGLHIPDMIPEARTNTERVESILYLLLLYIAWFQTTVYGPLRWYIHHCGKYLSIIKLAKWIIDNTMRWLIGKITLGMKKEILYYCCYDTRCRTNADKRLDQFYTRLA